jgi:hypothetical protein
MKAACRIAVAALLLVSLSPAGIAQMGIMRTPDMAGIWNPVVGAGGSYDTQSADGKTRHMDVFIAGKENVGGKDAYWLEIAIEGGQHPGAIVVKSLKAFDGTNSEVSRTIVQLQGHPPMEMSEQVMGGQQGSKITDIRSQGQNMGSETITVPSKEGSTTVLAHVITDAKDRVTGTPVPFDPMRMMQQGKQPQ